MSKWKYLALFLTERNQFICKGNVGKATWYGAMDVTFCEQMLLEDVLS